MNALPETLQHLSGTWPVAMMFPTDAFPLKVKDGSNAMDLFKLRAFKRWKKKMYWCGVELQLRTQYVIGMLARRQMLEEMAQQMEMAERTERIQEEALDVSDSDSDTLSTVSLTPPDTPVRKEEYWNLEH